MKTLRIFLSIIFVFMLVSDCFATEIGNVYKHWGTYSYIEAKGLRIYYPDSIKDAIPRIANSFVKVREKVIKNFEQESNFVVTVILDEHDDIIESTVDSKFDFVHLCIFDEMNSLSARSYSLEKRFALSLSKTLVKRSTSNASFQWRRAIAMMLMPHWFVEGCSLNYAFPIDSIHYSRLLDMARNGRLYSLDDLNTITSQTTLAKEEMLFQAHSMMAYWESTLKPGADLELIKSIIRKPVGFDKAFKKYYGVSLKEAYDSYVKYISEQSNYYNSIKEPDILDVDCLKADDKIFRSYIRVSDDERIWVSSLRYTTENYDLFYRKGIQKPVILLKNVHPSLIYDSVNKEIIIGCYNVNGRREKRLALWSVTLDGRARCITCEAGSYKPLGIKNNRIYYVNSAFGKVNIMSVSPNENNSEKVELCFGNNFCPLDVALDLENDRVYFTFQTGDFKTHLASVHLNSKKLKEELNSIHCYEGDIRALKVYNGQLWFALDQNHTTTQLYLWDEDSNTLNRKSDLVGGVWDISISDTARNKIEVTTLHKGAFYIASLPMAAINDNNIKANLASYDENEKLIDFKSHKYKTEYATSLWKPALGRDASGDVIGVYNYRTDRLDRTSIMVAPTYGLKSHKWGYTSNFMRRFDLLKADLSLNDYTAQKSYMDNDYYERVQSENLKFEYPLRLDLSLSFGIDLSKRSISKNKGGGLTPTAGKDHSFFVNLKQKDIRTEPYNNIFPRKGRIVELNYARGSDTLFGGDMQYDSVSLKWDEYVPINRAYVLTLSGWIAQDDKRNGIRRPNDLSLGGDKYLRAYDNSGISGDDLRYASITLARPVRIELPKQLSWVRNEFSTIGIFYELGDVKSEGKFDYNFDRGIEVTSKILWLKRIPTSLKAGYAIRNGQKDHDTYFNFYFEDFIELIN